MDPGLKVPVVKSGGSAIEWPKSKSRNKVSVGEPAEGLLEF